MKFWTKAKHFSQDGRIGSHTREEWMDLLGTSPRCHYCGIALTGTTATKDHLTPTCRGGSDLIGNIVVACLSCNQMKSWRNEEEFRAAMPYLSTRCIRAGGKHKPKTSPSLEERINEPGLLKRLKAERERTSWAWRNPV